MHETTSGINIAEPIAEFIKEHGPICSSQASPSGNAIFLFLSNHVLAYHLPTASWSDPIPFRVSFDGDLSIHCLDSGVCLVGNNSVLWYPRVRQD